MNNNLILYILMRNDLPSMNPGKAMAQASHAANAFAFRYRNRFGSLAVFDFQAWEQSTKQGFGTVLVLSATQPQIKEIVVKANSLSFPSELIWDTSYPYRTDIELASLITTSFDTIPRQIEGKQVNLWREETTCAYVFGPKEQLSSILGHLPLHP